MKLRMFQINGDSPLVRLGRALGLVVVTFAVGFAFWHTNEQTLEKIQERRDIHDATGLLTPDDLARVKEFAAWLRSGYGITLRLKVADQVLRLPEPDPRTLFVGVNPATGAAAVELPPLLRKSLPPEVVHRLEDDHFAPYMALDAGEGAVARGILDALQAVRDGLAASPSTTP